MINKVTLLGRVGKKETKTTSKGILITMIAVATNKKWTDKSGEKQESTTWHNVNCFHKVGEIAEKYINVGDLVYIEGALFNKRSTAENGEERWYSSITANEIKKLPSSQKKNTETNGNLKNNDDDFFNSDDDIPF